MKLTPSDMNFSSDDSGSASLNLSQGGDVPPFRQQSIELSAKTKLEVSKGGTIGFNLVEQTSLEATKIDFAGTSKDPVEMPAAVTQWENTDAKAQMIQ